MYVYVSITKLKSRRKMSSNTARVMSVSLDQLEKSEAKMRSTERQRAKTQSNNAYCLLAALLSRAVLRRLHPGHRTDLETNGGGFVE